MKNIKYLLGLVIFLITINVYGLESCTQSELSRLQELANNVEIKYERKIIEIESENNNDPYIEVIYNVNIINMNKDLKLYIRDIDTKEKEVTVEELADYDFSEGTTKYFEIKAWVNNLCVDSKLKTIKIEFPYYNNYYYYNKEKCKGYEEFKYCKENIYSYDKSFAEIDKLYSEYQNKERNENIKEDIEKIANKYLIPIIILSIAIIVVIILIKNKSKKKVVKI